jgi:hypothetical protein
MGRISPGAITGVVIGSVIFLIIVITGIIYLSHHESAKRHAHSLHLQRERNANKTVRDRAGTLIHGDEGTNTTGKGVMIGHSHYHETVPEVMEKRV